MRTERYGEGEFAGDHAERRQIGNEGRNETEENGTSAGRSRQPGEEHRDQ